MTHDPWKELLAAVRESHAGGHRPKPRGRRGERRVIAFDAAALVALRKRFGLSQTKFARMLGISVATLRGWEQRRRVPVGPARMLLEVCSRFPREVLAAAAGARRVPWAAAALCAISLSCHGDPPPEPPYPRPLIRPRPHPSRNRGRAPA